MSSQFIHQSSGSPSPSFSVHFLCMPQDNSVSNKHGAEIPPSINRTFIMPVCLSSFSQPVGPSIHQEPNRKSSLLPRPQRNNHPPPTPLAAYNCVALQLRINVNSNSNNWHFFFPSLHSLLQSRPVPSLSIISHHPLSQLNYP